ncbi:MAG: trigger factor [Luteibaculaceae bacterium]
MEVNKQAIDDLNAVLSITLKAEDYVPGYEKSLKNYSKQVAMPGFRQGKVPMSMVKKKYGPSIMIEEINKIIGEKVNEFIKTQDNLLGEPLPEENSMESFNFDSPSDIELKFRLGFAPEFTIPLGEKDAFDFYKVEVSDKDLEDVVKSFTRRYGKMSQPEVSEEKDMLFVNLTELTDSGEIVEEGVKNTTTISLEFLKDEAVKKELIGKKVSDSLDIDPATIAEDEADLKKVLGVESDEQLEALKGKKFRLVITDVRRLEPAELNADLFKKVLGDDSAETEADFKAKLKTRLEERYVKDAEFLFKIQVRDAVIEKLDFQLPDEFLKNWIKYRNEKEISDEALEQEFPMYLKDMRWQLTEGKVIKEHNLKVEFADIISHVKGIIASQYAQYGLPAPSEEELDQTAIKALKNREDLERINRDLYADKVVTVLAGMVKKNEVKVTAEELSAKMPR